MSFPQPGEKKVPIQLWPPDAEPLQVVDPRTNAAYGLIPLTEYEAVRKIVEDERQQRAIRAVGLRNAGRRQRLSHFTTRTAEDLQELNEALAAQRIIEVPL